MTSRTTYIALALATVALSACSEQADDARPFAERPAPVIAEPLQYEKARTRIEAVGTTRAILSAEIYPAVSGEVVSVDFEPGQFVRKGDVLVGLDAREATLELRRARLRLTDAERLLERYRRSADSGAVLPTVLDEAETAVESARIDVESAKIQLDYHSIEAVFDGHVGTTDVDPGDRIGPDTMITTLDDRSELLLSFDIPESFVGELEPGDRVSLQTWNRTSPPVEGEIVDIGSRIDPQNRTFEARARVPNEDDRLRPGMSFRVTVDVEGNEYPVVTETALQWGADGAFVWSVVEDRAVRVPVQVIQRREGRILVDGDFGESRTVVVEGTQRMREGVLVKADERLADAR